MMPSLDETLAERLAGRRAQGLWRSLLTVADVQGPRQTVDGQVLRAFCSNDYLGLAAHPEVRAALVEGVQRHGVGAGAAHLVNGHFAAHAALERALATFTGRERALLLSTGYMANLAVLGVLAGRHDLVFQDRWNHASLIDAGQSCGARVFRYRHADMDHLAERLAQTGGRPGARLIVTDGVFSMDGDLAPLPELAALAARHEAWLVVDDAHGFGVLGAAGRGTVAHFGMSPEQVPVLVGTLGKAFGTAGAFVAGSECLIESLIQFGRPYVYTTAQPPALAEATLAALELLSGEAGDERRRHLRMLIRHFRAKAAAIGLSLMPSETPIQPILLGPSERAVCWARALRACGFLVPPIRPPTVPEGTARLRVTLSAAHTLQDVDDLLAALTRLQDRAG
ncbi:MAG: 8-amino-7-oxononanoate synthase [Halothiobacillaceae bacterium]